MQLIIFEMTIKCRFSWMLFISDIYLGSLRLLIIIIPVERWKKCNWDFMLFQLIVV